MSLHCVQRSLEKRKEEKEKAGYARKTKQSWIRLRFKRVGNWGKFGGKEKVKMSNIPQKWKEMDRIHCFTFYENVCFGKTS